MEILLSQIHEPNILWRLNFIASMIKSNPDADISGHLACLFTELNLSDLDAINWAGATLALSEVKEDSKVLTIVDESDIKRADAYAMRLAHIGDAS